MSLNERNSSVVLKVKTPKALPAREEVELLAYQIYLDRGAAHRQDVDDWLQAERELLEEFDAQTDRKAKAQSA
jgi:hypothetical protein